MKIALTGGTGFIGSWLIKMCRDKHDIRVISRASANEDSIRRLDGVDYTFVENDEEQLKYVITGCEAVVHAASRRQPMDGSEDSFEAYYESLRLHENLLKASVKAGISRFINISTKSVYGSENALPYSEEQIAMPDTHYGISKLAAEKLCEMYSRNHGLSSISLRLAQVIGLGERENILTNFISKAQNKQTLEIWGADLQRRSYVYVKDVISAIGKALSSNAGGSVNIAMPGEVSNSELAGAVNNAFNNADKLTFRPEKLEKRVVEELDVTKAQNLLKWSSSYSLRDIFLDIKRGIDNSDFLKSSL